MNKKVLIVDDEEEIVAFMGRFLKRLNIDSVLAISGEEALEKYKSEHFDCVFLDVHLGGISGIEVLKRSCGFQKESINLYSVKWNKKKIIKFIYQKQQNK